MTRRLTLLLILLLWAPTGPAAEEAPAEPEDGGWLGWLPPLPFDDEQALTPTSGVPVNAEQLQPGRRLTIWGLDGGPARAGVWQRNPDGSEESLLADGVPVRFSDSGAPLVDGASIRSLESVLEDLGEREGLRLHFTGHTDGSELDPDRAKVFGGATGLSAWEAEQVATYVRRRLGLPADAVTWSGAGASDPLADPGTADGRRRNHRVEVRAWYQDPEDATPGERYVPPPKTRRVRICRQETACVIKRRRRDVQVVQLQNAVDPIRFEEPLGELPPGTFDALRSRLEALGDVNNLQVRFIGHTDAAAIGRLARDRFIDATGLSRAYAREVAAAARDRLDLDEHQVMIDARGASEPLAPNDTTQGRALNRRVEIEIWHDARGSGSTISDIQACPADGTATEYLTEPYRPDGRPPLEPVPFIEGEPKIEEDWLRRLVRIVDSLAESGRNPRVNFVGHTEQELLDRRAALVYGDERALSEVRARRVMDAVKERTELAEELLQYEGKGFSEPPEDTGFGIGNVPDGRVEARILIDVPAPVDPDWMTEVVELTRDTEPRNPYSLPPMRITVDGERIPDGLPHTADVQRCTDVALDQASVKMRYDNLKADRRLAVRAEPPTIAYEDDPETDRIENRTTFHAFSNYGSFHERAEVRLFAAGDPVVGKPLDVAPLGPDGVTDWYAEPGMARGLKYVLRVYDAEGRFDETAPKRLWLVHERDPVIEAAGEPGAEPDADAGAAARRRLASLDATVIARRNIPLDGGTVTITGSELPEGVRPWVMGEPVDLDEDRGFVVERLVPRGLHTVEVALLDDEGNGDVYLRDLRLGEEEWYTVGIADLTIGVDDTNGPAELVTQDDQHYDSGGWVDGRLAFYTNGYTDNAWEITGSADTREGPLDEIFSNFLDKQPDALFRRFDTDRYQPTYGDDSTTVEDAPTSGKFYIKAEKDRTFGMWGNFEAEILDNQLAQIDRGLYGGYGHYESADATSFGERKTEVDIFGAEPGTVAAREEFRGTGGSLFFLQHQDLVQGSDRLRVEVRDRESGLVLEVNNLVAGEDYELDPIQGRVLLTAPLPSTADDSSLVQADSSISGNPVFLIARYEYTPGFDELNDVSVGGRASQWIGDSVQLGVTAQSDEQAGSEQELAGVDLTWRDSDRTWLRVENARTSGVGTTTLLSDDGGFDFQTADEPTDPDADANAWRIESAAKLGDLVSGTPGDATVYLQQREAGFSAPGQATTRDTDQAGGTLDLPIDSRTSLRTEIDHRKETDGLGTDTLEVDVSRRLDERWEITSGVRFDSRDDDSPVVPDTQTEGRRTDVAVRADYTPDGEDWTAYGFAQATAETTESRDENSRVGGGGSLQFTDRLRGEGELSGGDTGVGAKLGTSYLYTDATQLYATYTLDNERQPTTGILEREGSFVSGFRTRYSDSLSLYGEERVAHGDVPSGLTHAFGADKQIDPGWTMGLSLEAGTLEDQRTGAETERRAFGINASRTGDALDYRGAIEFRTDETETNDRSTYLLKNRLRYKLSESSRLVGKLDLSQSDSSEGEFFDGEFVEAVLGYGLRPVGDDRWNALFKYTYFFNLPAPEQQTITGSGSEFIQRSHILSADAIYQLSPQWSIGGKYAYRLGELALSRVDPDYFQSRAELTVLRADWHVLRRWDLVLEGRRLDLVDAGDVRDGMLVGLYRHFGDHIKIGVGYNYTDFSDDLTDLSYDSQGAFINVVGKY